MYHSAVIDNSSLVYLCHLHKKEPIFNYLRSIFHTIYFPSEVIREFAKGSPKEPHRDWILQRLNPESGFYRLCGTYDSFVLIAVENYKGIDKGEAEAYAQLKKVNAPLIISDDKKFTEALKKLDNSIRVYNTLHLLSWLNIAELLPNWNNIIKETHKIRPFKSMDLREAYKCIAERFSLDISKKIISKKCSLSKILS